VLGTLGSVLRCGELGTGAALKLVVNTAMITTVTSLGEVLALADALGVPTDLALDALASGPLGGLVNRVRGGGGQFAIALAAKDLDLAVGAVGHEHNGAGGGLGLARVARERLRDAIAAGSGDANLTTVIDHIRSQR
jgi:3-hydroxyisobutyrate dehydrogenase-like beta-hydroxyacid dehydrogenase